MSVGASHVAAALSRSPVPLRRAVMQQRWEDVVFLHWPYDPAAVQRLLPAGVQVDTFDGAAWVSLVPFRMVDLRLPGRRPLPFGTFPEVNVRTYVRHGARRGVWFFSLDIDRIAPTVVARTCYRLPYCQGRVDHVRVGDLVTTVVDRAWPRPTSPARAELVVRTGAPLPDDDRLATFLTARWGLLARSRRRLLWAPVEHEPWPLHRARVEHLDESLVAACGLASPSGAPLAMWCRGVDVRVGAPTSA